MTWPIGLSSNERQELAALFFRLNPDLKNFSSLYTLYTNIQNKLILLNTKNYLLVQKQINKTHETSSLACKRRSLHGQNLFI
jgi:hypothetical protein